MGIQWQALACKVSLTSCYPHHRRWAVLHLSTWKDPKLEGLPGVCTDPVSTGARLPCTQPTPGHLSHVSPALLTSWHPGLWIPTSSLQTSSPPWDWQPSELQSHSPRLPVAFMGSDPHCLSRPKTLNTITYTRRNWLGGEIARPRHCPYLQASVFESWPFPP